jgi:two-component system sensor histidine kinase BaeS
MRLVHRIGAATFGSVVCVLAAATASTELARATPDRLEHTLRLAGLVFLTASVAALVVSAVIGRHVAMPLARASGAIRSLSEGRRGVHLTLDGAEELRVLALGISSLGQALERDTQARQQWIADTAHEVRTPLTVLHAELDAMLEGVRPIDREAVVSLKTELDRLTSLAASLGQLMVTDQRRLELECARVDLGALAESTLATFASRLTAAGLAHDARIPEAPEATYVTGDPTRLLQVLENLLENAIRYTDEGGRVELAILRVGARVVLHLDDTAPSVPEADLPRLFDRFFRVEPSRSRAHGGSGLGLSIARELVLAQGGTIAATPSPLGGLRVTLDLPAHPNQA